jgi:hypothetical protein
VCGVIVARLVDVVRRVCDLVASWEVFSSCDG